MLIPMSQVKQEIVNTYDFVEHKALFFLIMSICRRQNFLQCYKRIE